MSFAPQSPENPGVFARGDRDSVSTPSSSSFCLSVCASGRFGKLAFLIQIVFDHSLPLPWHARLRVFLRFQDSTLIVEISPTCQVGRKKTLLLLPLLRRAADML
jgi:hypothetical protein